MSSPTQAVVWFGLTSSSAYPMVNSRLVNFRADGSPSRHTVANIGQRNLLGAANLRIIKTSNALFLANGGEAARAATTISYSSGLRV